MNQNTKTKYRKQCAKIVRDTRKRLGVSGAELGRRIGKTRFDIYNYEKNRVVMPAYALLAILDLVDQ